MSVHHYQDNNDSQKTVLDLGTFVGDVEEDASRYIIVVLRYTCLPSLASFNPLITVHLLKLDNLIVYYCTTVAARYTKKYFIESHINANKMMW